MTYPPSEAFGYQFEGGELPLALLIITTHGARFEPLATLERVADEDQVEVAADIVAKIRGAADAVEAQAGVLAALADILRNAGTTS